MAEAILWENQFKDFLLSEQGRRLIAKSLERQQDVSRSITSVFFIGCDLVEYCPGLLYYLKVQPTKTLARCHEIVTEMGRQVLSEKSASVQKMVVCFHLKCQLPFSVRNLKSS